MFLSWGREFNSRFAVKGKHFTITLPISDILKINSIHYTKIGNWIELRGTMEEPKVSSILNIDGQRTATEGINLSRDKCFSCRTCCTKEEEGKETKAQARTEQLF